jgi:putative ABC transport system ATP-binding protein
MSSPPPLIELRQLTKVYESGEMRVTAVAPLDLSILRGQFVAVMGSSGSGKSTLMNIIGCLDRPTSGNYILDGTEVSSLSKSALSVIRNHKIGFVFQGFNLLNRTSARENVELPLIYGARSLSVRAQHEKAHRLLEKVGLGQRADHWPSQLSGGQQQRVAIARALVNDPVLLLADEPTGNLDSRTSLEIMALFQSLHAQGLTIVMVTHEPDIAAFCQRHIVMKDGRVRSDDFFEKTAQADEELKRLGGADYLFNPA